MLFFFHNCFLYRFTVAAFVGSRQFPPVEVRNKKDGKKEAADQALRVLMAEGQFQPQPSQKASSVSTRLTLPMLRLLWYR